MNWRGFWQGTATALPTVKSGTELLFDIQKQPLALEAAKNKLDYPGKDDNEADALWLLELAINDLQKY